ncbi:MAG: hypothetical protein KDJ75_07465 [Alphaproteobacteria bacterium]|nr:hypothetical protein [Alphaproteobacteria bacterium]
MGFVNEKEKSRVIDYERNIYLTRANSDVIGRGSPDDPRTEFWDLPLGDNPKDVVWFGAFYTQKEITKNNWHIKWTMHKIVIPEHLKPRRFEIKDLIEEALETFGVYYGKKNVSRQEFAVYHWLKTFE